MKRPFYIITAKASISKYQYRNITREQMMSYFYQLLKSQHHSRIREKDDSIAFEIDLFDISLTHYNNKFNNYSSGSFYISENQQYININFEGDIRRGLYLSLGLPIAVFVLSLIVGIFYKQYLAPLIPCFLAIIFPLCTFFLEKITRPLYLTGIISRMKEDLRDGTFSF